MTAAWGNEGGIDVRYVCTDGIEFQLMLLSEVGAAQASIGSTKIPEGAEVKIKVKVTLIQPTGEQETLEKPVVLHEDYNGTVLNIRDLVSMALDGDAPVGLFDPPYKWWRQWPRGKARVSYQSDSTQVRWPPTLVGTKVVVDFKTVEINGKSNKMKSTSDYVLYIEDGRLPVPLRAGAQAQQHQVAQPQPSEQPEGLDLPLRTSENIQGNILAGFNKDHQVFLFLHFDNPANAREWLSALLSSKVYRDTAVRTPVSDGACWIATTKDVTEFNDQFRAARLRGSPDGGGLKAVWVNVALTFKGICQLPPEADGGLRRFFDAFCEGPAARAASLGDVDDSEPRRWVFGREDDEQEKEIHALLTVAADDVDDLRPAFWQQFRLAEEHEIHVVYQQRGDALPGAAKGREHFGFRDGVSQPDVKNYTPPDAGTDIVPEDQFLLTAPPEEVGWMKEGSFLVFRRLAQDVAGWLAQVVHESSSLPAEDQMTAPLFAAKLIGRWPSGTPLAQAPIRDYRPAKSPEDNQFDFRDDSRGEKTPLFAHIRRQNPRDGSNDSPRIIRRGIPFGPPFNLDLDRGGSYGVIGDRDRGLCFNAFMADIDKFEELQQWAFKEPPDGPDALVGENGARVLRRPGADDQRIQLRRYVRTTGAVYAFAPSLAGLRSLAEGRL